MSDSGQIGAPSIYSSSRNAARRIPGWTAQHSEIEARLSNSDKSVIVIDGFSPRGAGREFNTLLSRLTERGVSLFVFSQEPPFEDSPSVYRQYEFDSSLFETIVELRFGERESHYPVTLRQVK